MNTGRLPLPLALVLLLAATGSAPAATLHVPAQYPWIQAGLDAASDGDTVLVADGVYSGSGNHSLRFNGKDVTLRSAGGPDNCIIDGGDAIRAVSFNTGDGPGAIIEGFTIRNCRSTQGAGILCSNTAAPRILNNVIIGCTATINGGGGIYCANDAQPLIAGNTIIGNTAANWGGGIRCGRARVIGNSITGNVVTVGLSGYGAGIAVTDGPCEIRGNVISGNQINADSCFGGGIYIDHDVTAVVHDNQLYFNLLNGETGSGAGIFAGPASVTDITGNRLTLNQSTVADHRGGGIYVSFDTVTTILDNRLVSNSSEQGGGAWIGSNTVAVIMGNLIEGNECGDLGGAGLYLGYTGEGTVVQNNLLVDNNSPFPAGGGGISCASATATMLNNTFTGNSAGTTGGGIHCYGSSDLEVINCILWGNTASLGSQIGLEETSSMVVRYSDLQGGSPAVYRTPDANLLWGQGNISQHPELVSGPLGDYYLSQTAAGQPIDSPCVDAGEPGSPPLAATTRTDCLMDDSSLDMGYHQPMTVLLAGPGRGYDNPPRVRVFPPEGGASAIHDFMAYGAQNYGVNVATGDLDGDRRDEILTGAGPGAIYGPHVRGFEMDGTPISNVSFLAYGTNKYGVNVAAGDIDGDGVDEVVTGAGPGAVFGPHVRAFSIGSGGATPVPGVSYFAYGTLKWGVNVACGDIDGDGFDEIVSGAGPGNVFGPHVRGWDYDDGSAATAKPAVSFLAYGTNKYGVNVACGDLDGDGIDEILTGPGPGVIFGTHIRGWDFDGGAVAQLPGFSFFAWPADVLYGARVATATVDDSLQDLFLVGFGPNPDVVSLVNGYVYHNPNPVWRFQIAAFPDTYRYGTTLAGGLF